MKYLGLLAVAFFFVAGCAPATPRFTVNRDSPRAAMTKAANEKLTPHSTSKSGSSSGGRRAGNAGGATPSLNPNGKDAAAELGTKLDD